MTLTHQQLDDLERFGSVFFSFRQIAIVMELDPLLLKKILNDPTTPAYKRYHKGRLQSEFDIRLREVELAKSGSTQAQELIQRHIQKLELEHDDE